MAAGHELVLHLDAEGVTHAAMPAADADTGLHSFNKGPKGPSLQRLLRVTHGPHGDDKVHAGQLVRIVKNVERIKDLDLKAFVA